MQKIKWHLLLVVVFAVTAAFVSKPKQQPPTVDNYSYRFTSSDGLRMYYGKDLTAIGYVKGFDYGCIAGSTTCTFHADPANAQSDLTGTYFFTWNVPAGGIDNSGTYFEP